ncbi:MAG: TolC family protein [Spirochaetes bacterium]|nr:TolC family protein [Spirochaetota bacterium]
MKRGICIIYTIVITANIASGQEPFTLKTAIEYALKNSITLTSLKARVQSTRLIIHERLRELLPSITVQYTKMDNVAIREQDTRNQSLLCTAQYDIFTSRKALIAYSISELESLLALEEYNIEKNTIILNTKKGYFDLQKKKKAIEIYTMLLDSFLLQKQIITAQQKLGMATELERIQVDGKIAEAQYNIISAQNDYANALSDFATFLNIEPSRIDVEAPQFEEFHDKSLPTKEHLIALALQQRNELKKSHYAVIKTQKEYELARYYYMPKIQIFASYGYTGEQFPMNKQTWNVGISVTSTIFGNTVNAGNSYGKKDNGNTTTSDSNASLQVYDAPDFLRNIVDSEAAYTQAIQTYEQLKRSIASDVSKTYDSLIESTKKVEIAKQQVLLLEKQATIENERVRLGDITRYDVLKTLLELSQARLQLQSTITDVFIAIALLENAVGVPQESFFKGVQ